MVKRQRVPKYKLRTPIKVKHRWASMFIKKTPKNNSAAKQYNYKVQTTNYGLHVLVLCTRICTRIFCYSRNVLVYSVPSIDNRPVISLYIIYFY